MKINIFGKEIEIDGNKPLRIYDNEGNLIKILYPENNYEW